MKFKRSSGILLHPTSLPGKYGIGTLGNEAFRFVDFLVESRQKLWQILPLGPTGYGDSPYQCFSSVAGNPLIINLELLKDEGFLEESDFINNPNLSDDFVDYYEVINHKFPLLQIAFKNFINSSNSKKKLFQIFCDENKFWLDDYALFMALKSKHNLSSWTEWEPQYAYRNEKAIKDFVTENTEGILFNKFIQFIFFEQWLSLKDYANKNGIKIIGDIPIYISADSVETWTQPEIFLYDKDRNPIKVAGVPPDYFSATGQLWGNPIYDWNELIRTDFKWWKERIKANLNLYDIVRIDHFRGFSEYWAIPYGEKTAINGKWVACPGRELFKSLLNEFGELPIIAEDLGVITDDVEKLRDDLGLPGMKILQFAFDSNEQNNYLPHTYEKKFVVFTGTHDNDTVKGWFNSTTKENQKEVVDYMGKNGENISWAFIRLALSSVADISIIPLQDLLEKDNEARMNLPGTTMGNWKWRFKSNELSHKESSKMAHLTRIFGR